MPLTVSVVAGQVAETVDVCIDGHGPYPFILDYGSGPVDHRRRAGTPAAPGRAPARPREFAGVGCTGTARPVSVGDWSLDGVDTGAAAAHRGHAAPDGREGRAGGPARLRRPVPLRRRCASTSPRARWCCPARRARRWPSPPRTPGPQGPAPAVADRRGERDHGAAHGDAGAGRRVAQRGGPLRRAGRGTSFVVDTGSSQSVVSSGVARAQSLHEHRPGPASGHRVLGDHRARSSTAGRGRCRACRSIPSSSGPRTSAPSARRARRACWARTSSGVTAGSSSTTPAARWSWADGDAWCGRSGPGRRR